MLDHHSKIIGAVVKPHKQFNAIVEFLNDIGIEVHEQPLPDDTFLSGIMLDRGRLLVDRTSLLHPGDLLHEAGHIAVMAPSQRQVRVGNAGDEQGEEIAAHAWSYAAAVACGVPPELVFHDDGYQGSGPHMASLYREGAWPGVPLLAWYGLTGMPCREDQEAEKPVFPDMKAWIRTIEDPSQHEA